MTEGATKRRFLVVYDYGQGGVWAFVWARSVDELHKKFRDLQVIEEMPSWLTGDQLAITEQRMTFDIDDVKPDDRIERLLRQAQCRSVAAETATDRDGRHHHRRNTHIPL